ncbi:MAG: glycoside hydrolase 43 family protein [Lachnospiraceae bacterium]|nr:glycoside hydrolase 43 family protein [Lachnospiraceae bacterium]
MEQITGKNPIIYSDYPDADVIRVEDTYYMISTTMHFLPGGVILRSYDLLHWEIASYVYESLDDTPGQRLADGKGIYGKGMWAASIRYHKGTFYVCFVANDTGKTYLYRSEHIEGPWRKSYIEGFYHDNSILFDEDGRVYIAYGNREIYITELNEELTAPKEGGLHRMAVKDTGNVILGLEGAHFYKINGKYYLFFIHWPKDGLRTEACYCADSLLGEFTGGDVLSSDLDGRCSGTAQGGIVDTPSGDWYAILFQDHGAVGRIPVLVPVTWENDFPVFGENGKAPKELAVSTEKADYSYEPLWCNDDFTYVPDGNGKIRLKKPWQWNHTPDASLWSVTEKPGTFRIRSGKLSTNVCHAGNTLTQRTVGEHCAAEVTLDGSELRDGDYAGLCALQGEYGLIALTKEKGQYFLVRMKKRKNEERVWMGSVDTEPGEELVRIPIEENKVTLRMICDFSLGKDTAEFFWRTEEEPVWQKLGETHQLYFCLDHFVGCRFALFLYSTKETGGVAEFTKFVYETEE